MRILFVHNEYLEIGGEDIAVQNEINYLKEYYEVNELIFSNNIKNYFLQIFYFLINKNYESKRILEDKIIEFQPDIVYVHNTWFAASLEVFRILKKHNVNTIIKLHNFRYRCTKSYSAKVHTNNNEVCLACGFAKTDSKFNKYYKESILKSFLVLRYGKKFFQILQDPFFKLAVLTKFHKKYLEDIGFKNNIFVFPNYLEPLERFESLSKKDYIVYAGRISSEKGLEELVDVFKSLEFTNYSLKIIGEGPLLKQLKFNENIEFLGRLSNEEVLNIVANARAVVTCTKLYEGQPNFLCEASMLGIPSIFPRSGGIEEFFPKNYKLSFEQFNYFDFKEKLKLVNDENFASKVGNENKNYLENLLNKNVLIEMFEKMVKV